MQLGPTKVTHNDGMWGFGTFNGFPLSGSVSSPFGSRQPILTPQGWTSDFHTGVDIPAAFGTPIFCPANGKVAASYADGAGGQTVVVRFDDGTGAMFIHMQGIMLGQGTTVRRGDIVGLVGSSGLSTGPHLHFSLLSQVLDGPTWYDRAVFLDPMQAQWIESVPNSEVHVEPEVVELSVKEQLELIRTYIDQGVPYPVLANMLDVAIARL